MGKKTTMTNTSWAVVTCASSLAYSHLAAQGWAYALNVLPVIYKLNLKNIVYWTTLSLNWYENDS